MPHNFNNNAKVHRSNAEYGLIPAGSHQNSNNHNLNNPLANDSESFDSRIPNPGTANYSNVQIVCRINAPNKPPSQTKTALTGLKRPNSACRISFHSAAAPSFKGKDNSTPSIKSQVKLNPRSSFMSVHSTPAMRSPSKSAK